MGLFVIFPQKFEHGFERITQFRGQQAVHIRRLNELLHVHTPSGVATRVSVTDLFFF